ncbi:hemerythrin [Oryzomicrobium terrae]|jgi:hemerythrin-like metal-binding protein|uniref:Hemerythrin n=1 Tax=Oryzomicrobium terrae TaxID=1735038 RepID=A0A5C1EBP2_9RHOO|nr:bacteriohemerythrin [Oryzomicrobium terrae]QEL66302.1 hemerythrin [Oryzomicrobium terrae]
MSARDGAIVAWQDSYSVGMEEIDAQHQALFSTINRLWAVLVGGKEAPGEVLGLIEELERYTVAHFSAEETFMERAGYPGLAAHRALHAQFVQRIAAERQSASQGRRLSLDLLHFLKDWLVEHILVQDQQYAAYCRENKARSSGLSGLFKRFWA